MDITLIECPGDRIVLLCGGVLVFAEGPSCRHPHYDAKFVAEALARAASVGDRVHPAELPPEFAVWDEDGPLPSFTAEDVARWWVNLCDAQAEEAAMASPPPAPTLAEQVLGIVAAAGMEITDAVRRLVGDLEKAALADTRGGNQD